MAEIVQTRVDIRVQTRVDQEMPRISERVQQLMIQRAQPLAGVATSPSANASASQAPKPSIDWTAKMPPLRDQGAEGSVVGLALATTFEFYISQATGKSTAVSAREIYYEVRSKQGTFPHDAGGFIKDGIDFLRTTGVVAERAWPYHSGQADRKPPASLANEKRYKITDAKQIVTLDQLKSALGSGPAVAGLTVYEGFASEEVSKTGILPTPKAKDKPFGGHAICIVGYDDPKKLLKFQNSWGPDWGDHGFGYISYDYFREQSADCWTFRYAGESNP
jgi:C1A family cysteine protease